MFTDPIADMLTRIRNGYLAKKKQVLVPNSNFKKKLLALLANKHYIGKFDETADKRNLQVVLRYEAGKPAVTEISRVSKPGLRKYISVRELKDKQIGIGYLIISTPKGLMTHVEAKKQGLGGEIVCQVK